MSNGLLYDPLLVRYLAGELMRRLRGRPVRGIGLDRGRRRLVLALEDASLVWELHPARGWVRLAEAIASPPDDVPLHRRATLGEAEVPPD
ncbi:MAG: hypothetical protein ACODAE_04330, partial [Gemmatimonadota bacterium]